MSYLKGWLELGLIHLSRGKEEKKVSIEKKEGFFFFRMTNEVLGEEI